MTPTRQTTPGSGTRLPLWWHGLIYVCCLLAFLTSGSPALLLAPAQARSAAAEPFEGEEHSPIQEDDDGKDSDEQAGAARGHHGRQARRRSRSSLAAVTAAWLAHLPHRHVATAGYRLPTRTPFASGASCLPLRC